MYITIAGTIFLLISLYGLVIASDEFIIGTIIFSLIFQSSAFVMIGNYGVPICAVTEVVLVLKCIIKSKKFVVCIPGFILPLLMFSIYTFIITLIAPLIYSNMSFLNINSMQYENVRLHPSYIASCLLLILESIALICVFWIAKTIDLDVICNAIEISVYIVFAVGIWHYAMTHGNTRVVSDVFKTIIYSNTGVSPGWTQVRFLGTFYEPSYCGLYLSAVFWFLADRYLNNRSLSIMRIITIVLILCMLVLNMSTTGIFCFVVGAFFFLMSNLRYREFYKYALALLLLFTIGMLVFFKLGIINYDFLIRNTIEKKNTNSYIVRSMWNEAAIRSIPKTMFIGSGLGYTRANSLIINLLSQTGVIGFSLYIMFICKCIILLRSDGLNATRIKKSVLIYLLVTLFGMIFSCPDVTLNSFWIGLILMACVLNNRFDVSIKRI